MGQKCNSLDQAGQTLTASRPGIVAQLVVRSREWSDSNRVIESILIWALIGLVAGPVLGFALQLLGRGPFLNFNGDPASTRRLMLYACYGMLTGLFSFVTCRLPAGYLNPSLSRYPKIIYLPLRALIVLAGGLLALSVSSELILRAFGAHFIDEREIRLALYFCAGLSFILAFTMGTLAKLSAEVRETERLLYQTKIKERLLVEQTTTAKLRALQAQINPHFFLNALNSIAALLSTDAETARELIIDLAEMHRYTLKCINTKLVPLHEEVEFVRSYLNIEAVRFSTRLQIDFKAPEDLEGLRLPGLVLQPIVENAIKYGAARSVETSYVRIVIERGVTDFTVTVSNNSDLGQPLRSENFFLEGHALKNVSDRLTAVYGAEYGFNIASLDHHVCCKLRIPTAEERYHASATGR